MVTHILNGDSLKEQFPDSIEGDIIIVRECLIDGDVSGDSLEDFYETRAKSIADMFGGPRQDYIDKTVPELKKIEAIETGNVNLWFEDDLFCQVNFWFVCSRLKDKDIKISLVRPTADIQYGFGGMDKEALENAYHHKTPLFPNQVSQFAKMWHAYVQKDNDEILSLFAPLEKDFPTLKPAIVAQIERGNATKHGRPEKALLAIMNEIGSSDFGPVFREFCKREAVYGFGDLQVKRLFDRVTQKQ